MAIIVISTIWFVLHTLIEFRNLIGVTERGWLDLGPLIGTSIGGLFVLASIYSTALSLRRQRPAPSEGSALTRLRGARLRRVGTI